MKISCLHGLWIFLLLFGNFVYAQEPLETGPVRAPEPEKKQRVFITAGPEVGLLIPAEFGANTNISSNDTSFTISSRLRFRFGVSVRFDFSKKFSLQTGLYYVSRQIYNEVGRTASPGSSQVIDSLFQGTSVNYIGYEIPLMFLFYVQLGEKWYMNNALGFSFDFFPSSSESQDINTLWKFYNGRNSWFVPSARASVGFEHRTEKSGYFYLGGSFHRPLTALSDMMSGSRKTLQEISYQYFGKIPVSGMYFSVDFKYFLPPGKKNRFTK